jgi:hypothetical protein
MPVNFRTALAMPTAFGPKLFEITALLAVAAACKEQRWQHLVDGGWGRVEGQEGAERSVGQYHGFWKG